MLSDHHAADSHRSHRKVGPRSLSVLLVIGLLTPIGAAHALPKWMEMVRDGVKDTTEAIKETVTGVRDAGKAIDPESDTSQPADTRLNQGGLSREDVREIQTHLNALGHSVGPPDGYAGPKTSSAIEAFERDAGLPATGTPSSAVLLALRRVNSSTSDSTEQSAQLSDPAPPKKPPAELNWESLFRQYVAANYSDLDKRAAALDLHIWRTRHALSASSGECQELSASLRKDQFRAEDILRKETDALLPELEKFSKGAVQQDYAISFTRDRVAEEYNHAEEGIRLVLWPDMSVGLEGLKSKTLKWSRDTAGYRTDDYQLCSGYTNALRRALDRLQRAEQPQGTVNSTRTFTVAFERYFSAYEPVSQTDKTRGLTMLNISEQQARAYFDANPQRALTIELSLRLTARKLRKGPWDVEEKHPAGAIDNDVLAVRYIDPSRGNTLLSWSQATENSERTGPGLDSQRELSNTDQTTFEHYGATVMNGALVVGDVHRENLWKDDSIRVPAFEVLELLRFATYPELLESSKETLKLLSHIPANRRQNYQGRGANWKGGNQFEQEETWRKFRELEVPAILARVPTLPLRMISIAQVNLQDYDAQKQQFEVKNQSSSDRAISPRYMELTGFLPPTVNIALPTTLAMNAQQARELLNGKSSVTAYSTRTFELTGISRWREQYVMDITPLAYALHIDRSFEKPVYSHVSRESSFYTDRALAGDHPTEQVVSEELLSLQSFKADPQWLSHDELQYWMFQRVDQDKQTHARTAAGYSDAFITPFYSSTIASQPHRPAAFNAGEVALFREYLKARATHIDDEIILYLQPSSRGAQAGHPTSLEDLIDRSELEGLQPTAQGAGHRVKDHRTAVQELLGSTDDALAQSKSLANPHYGTFILAIKGAAKLSNLPAGVSSQRVRLRLRLADTSFAQEPSPFANSIRKPWAIFQLVPQSLEVLDEQAQVTAQVTFETSDITVQNLANARNPITEVGQKAYKNMLLTSLVMDFLLIADHGESLHPIEVQRMMLERWFVENKRSNISTKTRLFASRFFPATLQQPDREYLSEWSDAYISWARRVAKQFPTSFVVIGKGRPMMGGGRFSYFEESLPAGKWGEFDFLERNRACFDRLRPAAQAYEELFDPSEFLNIVESGYRQPETATWWSVKRRDCSRASHYVEEVFKDTFPDRRYQGRVMGRREFSSLQDLVHIEGGFLDQGQENVFARQLVDQPRSKRSEALFAVHQLRLLNIQPGQHVYEPGTFFFEISASDYFRPDGLEWDDDGMRIRTEVEDAHIYHFRRR